MAEEQTDVQGEETAAPETGKRPVLLIAAAAAAALAIGAGAAYVAIKPDAERLAELEAQAAESGETVASPDDPASGAPEPTAAAGGDVAAGDSGFADRVLALEPFVVNVTGHDYARYLKVKIELEAESATVRAELEERLPQVRDGVIVLLSSRRLADVTDFEGKVLLKEAIAERINGMLESGDVRQVMFTEFVVQ